MDESATVGGDPSQGGRFNVVQFFQDGYYEYVRRNVTAEEAMLAAKHYCTSVGVRLGFTVRVIVTDEDDYINFEWKRGEGVTFPPAPPGGRS
jgi:hypothetical protein